MRNRALHSLALAALFTVPDMPLPPPQLRRHYDADWETEEPILVSHLVSTMSCAEKLAGEAGVNLMEKPVLLITDFNSE